MKYRLRSLFAMGLSVLLSFSIVLTASATEADTPDPSAAADASASEDTDSSNDLSGQGTSGSGDISWPQGPDIQGESGVVIEASTGTVLYDKNMHDQHYPASITKILTVLLALENCSLDEMVTVPYEAAHMPEKGSHIALDADEQLTMKDCLYAMMLASANDAAYAVAIHLGGTIENFADMMNRRAQELGCTDSHFTNCNGLFDENHVSSAYDMALITREALKHETFREISGTVFYEIPPSDTQPDLIPMYNHHKMLTSSKYHYDGAFSGKTGYTNIARNTLVTCASRGGMELICVTMKTEGRQVYVDTASLLDFGFDHFQKINIAQNESVYSQSSVYQESSLIKDKSMLHISQDGYVIIPNEASFSDLTEELVYGPAKYEDPSVGLLSFRYGDRFVGSASLELTAPSLPSYTFQSVSASVSPGTGTSSTTPAAEPEKKSAGKTAVYIIAAVILFLALLFAIWVCVVKWQRCKRLRARCKWKKEFYSNLEDLDD